VQVLNRDPLRVRAPVPSTRKLQSVRHARCDRESFDHLIGESEQRRLHIFDERCLQSAYRQISSAFAIIRRAEISNLDCTCDLGKRVQPLSALGGIRTPNLLIRSRIRSHAMCVSRARWLQLQGLVTLKCHQHHKRSGNWLSSGYPELIRGRRA
jgi:hypothetical protein